MKEVWPFLDETSGAKIYEHKFYGFGDAGGLAGGFDGYDTLMEAFNDIRNEYEEDMIGFLPEDLGSCGITILSGREFIDRLRYVEPGEGELFYGKWSQE